MSLAALYSKDILRWAADIGRIGTLSDAQAHVRLRSPLCGGAITLSVRFDGDRVADYRQEIHACAIGQAAAAVVADRAAGLSEAEIAEGAEIMRRILKDATPPPPGRWADLAVFLPVADYTARHGAAMLPFDALGRAFVKARAGAGG